MSTTIILSIGLFVGIILRVKYIYVPLDWDAGILLYQSYWFDKLKRFIVGTDWIPESKNPEKNEHMDQYMIRSQALGFSLISLLEQRICKNRVWAYRTFDTGYYLCITAMIFLLGIQLFDPVTAAIAASGFFIFSCMPFSWTAMHNPEKFQILFTVIGLYFVILSAQYTNPFYAISAGLFFFAAMCFKQNVGFVILFSIIFVLIKGSLIDACGIISTTVFCYIVIFTYYHFQGAPFDAVFGRFFINSGKIRYIYNLDNNEDKKIVRDTTTSIWDRLKPNLISILRESGLLYFSVLGWIIYSLSTNPAGTTTIFLLLILTGTFIAFFAANKFFPYYYIPFLPIASLMMGNFFYEIFVLQPPFSPLFIVILILSITIGSFGIKHTCSFFFVKTTFEQGAYMYQNTLYNFGVSEEIGRHIRENSNPDDTIFVYNLNPEIYFFAQRKSPINRLWIDSISLRGMNKDETKKEFEVINQKLKDANPKYIVINKDTNVSISDFEQITKQRYYQENEYVAGYHLGKRPVYLQLFKLRERENAAHFVKEGEMFFGEDNIPRACETFQKALAFDPLNDEALNNLGVCYYKTGNHEKAMESFLKALQANPSNRDVVFNLLDSSLSNQDKEKVLQIYISYNSHDEEMKMVLKNLQPPLS